MCCQRKLIKLLQYILAITGYHVPVVEGVNVSTWCKSSLLLYPGWCRSPSAIGTAPIQTNGQFDSTLLNCVLLMVEPLWGVAALTWETQSVADLVKFLVNGNNPEFNTGDLVLQSFIRPPAFMLHLVIFRQDVKTIILVSLE